MRRVALVLAVMALVLVLASGVAWAVTKIGTNGPDRLRGTNDSDVLVGRGGGDIFRSRAGKDVIRGGPGSDAFLYGGRGVDVILGGPGNDDELVDGPLREFAVDSLKGGAGDDFFETYNLPVARDIVSCGAGRDTAEVDRKDIVKDDCEIVEEVY